MSIRIELKKSLIGASKNHIAVAKSLGLKKRGDFSDQPNNKATQGKVFKIAHLVKVVDL